MVTGAPATGAKKSFLPQNAKINVYGNGWECVHGYKRTGNRCEEVVLPENAKINLYGNGWECVHGYRRTGNRCEEVVFTSECKDQRLRQWLGMRSRLQAHRQ